MALSKKQHDELRKWRANTNKSGNTKKNSKCGGGRKVEGGGGDRVDGNNIVKKLRCLVSSLMLEEHNTSDKLAESNKQEDNEP